MTTDENMLDVVSRSKSPNDALEFELDILRTCVRYEENLRFADAHAERVNQVLRDRLHRPETYVQIVEHEVDFLGERRMRHLIEARSAGKVPHILTYSADLMVIAGEVVKDRWGLSRKPTTSASVKKCAGGACPVPQDKSYPHACPRCGGPAYVGLNSFDCKAGCR